LPGLDPVIKARSKLINSPLINDIGQFKEVYPHLTMPASTKQRLFFAGDATSACHGFVPTDIRGKMLIHSLRWIAGALNSAWRCVLSMLVAHPELNPTPNEDIIRKFMDEWGASEEWDEKRLQKHVYLGERSSKDSY
jgi:hypothetical protein